MKPKRPPKTLNRKHIYAIFAEVYDDSKECYISTMYPDPGSYLRLNDMKALYKWLGKCIVWYEANHG